MKADEYINKLIKDIDKGVITNIELSLDSNLDVKSSKIKTILRKKE